jgi:hypothetical protein
MSLWLSASTITNGYELLTLVAPLCNWRLPNGVVDRGEGVPERRII